MKFHNCHHTSKHVHSKDFDKITPLHYYIYVSGFKLTNGILYQSELMMQFLKLTYPLMLEN